MQYKIIFSQTSLHKSEQCYQLSKIVYQGFFRLREKAAAQRVPGLFFPGKGLDKSRIDEKVHNFFNKLAKLKTFASEKLKGGKIHHEKSEEDSRTGAGPRYEPLAHGYRQRHGLQGCV